MDPRFNRPVNHRSLKITILGYFAAMAMMITLFAIAIGFAIVLKLVMNI